MLTLGNDRRHGTSTAAHYTEYDRAQRSVRSEIQRFARALLIAESLYEADMVSSHIIAVLTGQEL